MTVTKGDIKNKVREFEKLVEDELGVKMPPSFQDEVKPHTRLMMTVPGRGRVVIEGTETFVSRMFNKVKQEFIDEMSGALFMGQIKGEVEIIEKTEGKVTTLEIVETASA
jgi:hypothetical protein